MADIDMNRIIATVQRQLAQDTGLTQSKLKAAATERFKVIFNDAVIGMQKEFEEDKVTQEVEGGIAASNISETLGGGEAPDNLFSFIGFKEGDNPIAPIREALNPSNGAGPKLGPTIKVPGNVPLYQCTISSPNLEKIYNKTPMPWGGGMSWAEKIETGIPGFARFLARFTKSENSRSGGGIQASGDLPSRAGASFSPPENGYLTRIFRNFINSVNNFKRQRFK